MITRASNQGIHLVADLLSYDPDKRPSATQSQRYPYFMNCKNAMTSASMRPQAMQQSAIPNGRLSIMDVEAMDNNALLSRFNVNPKYTSNSDMNEINSMLSVSRLSHNNNDKAMIIDTNDTNMKNSAKTYTKFQSNFNILNDMFNNLKTDTNNNDKGALDKNIQQQAEKDILPPLNSPAKKPEENDRLSEKEKINDVFINLLKDHRDPIDSNTTYNSSTSFFLHEPKPSAQNRARQRNDSGMSFKMLSKGVRDNSFDEGFFDSLNVNGKKSKASASNGVVKDWDEGLEDDELASILG